MQAWLMPGSKRRITPKQVGSVESVNADFAQAEPVRSEGTSSTLTTIQAAQRLGMSVAWVKLHAKDLGGDLTPDGYRFPASELSIERVTEKITFKRHATAQYEREEREAEQARAVFQMLDEGVSLGDIIKALPIVPPRAETIRDQWIKIRAHDENVLAVVQGRKVPPPAPPVTPETAPLRLVPTFDGMTLPPDPLIDETPGSRGRALDDLRSEVDRLVGREAS
jgi:hypothetical protein